MLVASRSGAARLAAPLWRALACTAAAASGSLPRSQSLLAAPSSRELATASAAASTSAPTGEAWPVIIAGGGPTGLTAALLLAKQGVRSVVLERGRTLTDHPQAHFINMRCMEVLRGIGGGWVCSVPGQVAGWLVGSEWAACIHCFRAGIPRCTPALLALISLCSTPGLPRSALQTQTWPARWCSACRPWRSGAASSTAPAWGRRCWAG